MEQRPLAQGAGFNGVISVYLDRVEISTGWQGQNTTSLGLKQVANIALKGVVNCTLTIEVNDGRHLIVQNMALPDARRVKAAVEQRKTSAGLYE